MAWNVIATGRDPRRGNIGVAGILLEEARLGQLSQVGEMAAAQQWKSEKLGASPERESLGLEGMLAHGTLWSWKIPPRAEFRSSQEKGQPWNLPLPPRFSLWPVVGRSACSRPLLGLLPFLPCVSAQTLRKAPQRAVHISISQVKDMSLGMWQDHS